MAIESHGMPAGAADKWKVLQLFHDSVPRSHSRVERIDRITNPAVYVRFRSVVGHGACEVVFWAPTDSSQLSRIQEEGFSERDFEETHALGKGVHVATRAGIAAEVACGRNTDTPQCISVLLCCPGEDEKDDADGAWAAAEPREYCIEEPDRLLLAYVVWYTPTSSVSEGEKLRRCDLDVHQSVEEADLRAIERRQLYTRQQREYAKVRDSLVKVALQGLEQAAAHQVCTVLLPTGCAEAEAVVSLYLLGGGGTAIARPPGVDVREALGSVVVQRIENRRLHSEYTALGCSAVQAVAEEAGLGASLFAERDSIGKQKTLRYRESVVWHGTRLKRQDGEDVSLVEKLQSIAEQGFDPHRCLKGAAGHAGGIWVATTPLASFGRGVDGLVAFILCLAKTHFNEWVDTTCARVLQRERVLPLYSLVHA